MMMSIQKLCSVAMYGILFKQNVIVILKLYISSNNENIPPYQTLFDFGALKSRAAFYVR